MSEAIEKDKKTIRLTKSKTDVSLLITLHRLVRVAAGVVGGLGGVVGDDDCW